MYFVSLIIIGSNFKTLNTLLITVYLEWAVQRAAGECIINRYFAANDISWIITFAIISPSGRTPEPGCRYLLLLFFPCIHNFFQPLTPVRVTVATAWAEEPMHNFSQATSSSCSLSDPWVLVGQLGDVIPSACPVSAPRSTLVLQLPRERPRGILSADAWKSSACFSLCGEATVLDCGHS